MDEEHKTKVRHELWRLGLLEWLLWPQQRTIYRKIRSNESDGEFVVMLCARQFGKSYLGTVMAIEDCIRHPESLVIIVGPTSKQTTDIVVQAIKKIEKSAPPGLIRRSKSESRWYIGSSELLIGGFELNTATRHRGKTLVNIYVEEVVDSNPDNYNESIKSDLGPALTHSHGGKFIFLTTPPKIPDHPFLTETVPNAMLHDAFYKYTIHDNEQLDQRQYAACVERCGGEETIEFRREYLCEVVRDENVVVLPAFNTNLHVQAFEEPVYCHYQVAIDWGGVRDKTCAVLMSYDYTTDTDLILDEFVWDANTPMSKIVPSLMIWEEKYKIQKRVADVPGQVQVDLRETFQYDITAPHKLDWMANVNSLNLRFALNKVKVQPHCKFIVANCQSGTFNKQKTDFDRSNALGHCDGIAALMYGSRSLDRTNPFPVNGASDSYFVKPKLAAAPIIEGRTFMNKGIKRF